MCRIELYSNITNNNAYDWLFTSQYKVKQVATYSHCEERFHDYTEPKNCGTKLTRSVFIHNNDNAPFSR